VTTPPSPRILLTGATGSFGRFVARALIDQGCELVCLGRGRDRADATRRVLAALGTDCAAERVVVVPGDVALPGLGLDAVLVRHLQATVDGIVHSAATTAFGMKVELARRVNVTGTRNVLDFARRARQLRRLSYVSTAFVAGKRTGTIRETELDHDAGFVTSYERSKYEAELLVRRSAVSLPVAVFRPSVIVDPGEDAVDRPNGLRFALSLLRNGVLPVLPAPATTPIDLIHASDAADALARLSLDERSAGTYHLTAGASAPSLAELMHAAGTPPIRFVPEEAFDQELGRLRRTNVAAAASYRRIDTFIRIVAYPKVFENDATAGALGGPVARRDPLAAVRATFPELCRSVA
jgi:thioester reductase-like protein